jgi:N4-gp56 family major capsid protein
MMQAYRTENSYRSAARLSPAELRAAMASGEILQATALAFDTRRQLRFELGGVKAVMPFAQCADGAETAVTSRKALDKSCTLTPKLFFQAAAQLGAMNADPIGDSYVAIIHPYAAYDLKTCKEFIEVHKYADPDTMFRGEIGKLGNIRFIETSEAKIWKDETCPTGLAVFGTLVLGAHAYGVTELEGGGLEHIVKQLGYGDDPLNQRASVGWKGMRAAERLVEQYMVRIESVSSYSANAAAN